MKLTIDGIKDRDSWTKASFSLPLYDVEEAKQKAIERPRWVHFGIGNIFRVFIGGIGDKLLSEGYLDRGITCVESFDYEVVDKIYKPFDNLSLSVILHNDGTREKRVIGAFSEAVKADSSDKEEWRRLKEVFVSPDLQIVSFTITEKGYALRTTGGEYSTITLSDIEYGPEKAKGAMSIVTSMLFERYKNGAMPIALVSMDNCSHNGSLLQSAVFELSEKWYEKGFVDKAFLDYLHDESKVSFPWTMIDKITPRPSLDILESLKKDGVEDIEIIETKKRTYIAPFVNAEGPQYLVIEDKFPNGRPELEKAGVYLTDRDTVDKSERMKVTACLNPIHTALGPYGVVLGYNLFSDEMRDDDMLALAQTVGYKEGLEVVPDPKILSPKSFLDECMNERFPNPYLGDTCQRLCTDASQGLGVRFGVTISSYVNKYGDAKRLIGIPLAISGWLRYLLGIDDEGKTYNLAPDPMAEEVVERLSSIKYGHPESVGNSLKWILSNKNLFFIDLYEAGIGDIIEEIFRKEIVGPGSVRKTIKEYLGRE